jgi:hypothetical protein
VPWDSTLECAQVFFVVVVVVVVVVYFSCFNAGGPSIKKRKIKKPSDLFPLPEVTIFNLVHALQDCQTLDEGCIGSLVPSPPPSPCTTFFACFAKYCAWADLLLHVFLVAKMYCTFSDRESARHIDQT